MSPLKLKYIIIKKKNQNSRYYKIRSWAQGLPLPAPMVVRIYGNELSGLKMLFMAPVYSGYKFICETISIIGF